MKLKVLDRIVVTSIRPQPLDRGEVTPDLPAAQARDLMKRLPGFFAEAEGGEEAAEAEPVPQPDGPHGSEKPRAARRAPETAAADGAPETSEAGRPAATPRKPKG